MAHPGAAKKTPGVQQLLAAEKKAAERIESARKLPCGGYRERTMASYQTQGIQQLLAAEKRAAEKVAEARKRKVKRIKQARDEAQADIEAYRRERERQFREYEARHMGSKEDVAAKIEKDTEVYLNDMERLVRENKNAVIDDLIDLCVHLEPKAHPNFFVMRSFNMI